MATIFRDWFDSGSFGEWNHGTAGAVEIVTNPVYLGAYAAKATGSSSVWEHGMPSAYGDFYLGCQVRFPVLPASGKAVYFLRIYAIDFSTWVDAGIYNDYGTMKWRLAAPSGVYSLPATISPATWYRVVLRRKTGSGNGVATMWVDLVEILTSTIETMTVGSGAFVGGCIWTNEDGFVVYSDDYEAADAPIGAPPSPGILSVDTMPVKGEVFVDGISWGTAPQNRVVEGGSHVVVYGNVLGYFTPEGVTVSVAAVQVTSVLGTYSPAYSISIDSTPISVEFSIILGGMETSYTTPWSAALEPNVYRFAMPTQVQMGGKTYTFSQWNDGDPNPVKDVEIRLDTVINLMATFVPTTPTLPNVAPIVVGIGAVLASQIL